MLLQHVHRSDPRSTQLRDIDPPRAARARSMNEEDESAFEDVADRSRRQRQRHGVAVRRAAKTRMRCELEGIAARIHLCV